MSDSPLTPLDYIATGYWQDFLAKRPIAGGLAYEALLREYSLDESLASLQRIDTLLSQIRRELIK
ncbi:tetratricopeptide repeat protein, partial [Psychrobacter sp. T6-1]